MIDTIINVLYYVLFFLAPLIMTKDTSELFEFNKMLFIYLITVLVLFFWLLKMIVHKRLIIRKSRFDIVLFIFLLTQILSTVFSIDRHTSFFGYYGRFNGGLLSIISYIVLYYAFISNVSFGEIGKSIIQKLLKTSLIASFMVILWGLPGKIGYDLSCFVFMGQLNNSCWTDQFHPELRMFSTLGQPDWLGAYLAINFFVALYFLLREFSKVHNPKPSEKKGYIKQSIKNNSSFPLIPELLLFGYLCLNFISILFTRSRSALLAVAIGLAVFSLVFFITMILNHNYSWLNKRRIILSLAIIFIPIFIFKTGFSTVDRFLSFAFLHSPKKIVSNTQVQQPKVPTGYKIVITDSLTIRKIVWQGAFELGNKYPLFGTGLETFAYAYYFVRPQAHNMTSEWDYLYNKAHNEFLNYFATAGYIGTIAYLLMIGFVFYLFLRLYRSHGESQSVTDENQLFAMTLLCSYVTILITNFIGFSTTTVNFFFYIIPAFLIIYSGATKETEKKDLSYSFSSIQWLSIIGSGIIALFLIVFLIRYYFADTKYALADAYEKKGDYQASASLLTEALQLKFEHVYEDKLSYEYANLAVVATYQKQQDIAQRLILMADEYNQKSINESPRNVLYWKTRAKNEYLFYQITLQKDVISEGIKALQKAAELSPTDPKIPYSLAIFYSLLGDEDKNPSGNMHDKQLSLQAIDKAINLKPDYRDSYVLKGQLQKKYGDKEGAKKTFEYILANINSDDVDVKKELQSF